MVNRAEVILVDENDRPRGTAEKLEAHKKGELHRAFSIFVFRERDRNIELLLQKRNGAKYHSGGLWTNTCCSHPAPGEETLTAGQRRLQEEMGFTVPLEEVGCFTYRHVFDDGLIEHEYDHVLMAMVDGVTPKPHPDEVEEIKWMTIDAIHADLKNDPQRYTPWFEAAFQYAIQAISLL